ncbi:MAG TPA: penicillin-binding protein 2 [Caulobacterales bacterium]|nr:penicillin-binding protein 2 [Caulobacterales bacterium]
MSAKRDLMSIFTRRSLIVMGAGGVGLAGIGVRLLWLQGEDAFNKEYTKAADSNRFDLQPIVPPRGVIYDRFGDALALASKDYRVSIVPEETENLEEAIRALGDLLGMAPETVARRIREAKNRRAFDEVLIKNNLEWPQFAAVNVRLPELKGVRAVVGEQRYYPYKEAFAHPVGYVQKASQGEIDRVEAADREAAGLPAKAQPGETFDSSHARYLRTPDVRIGKAGLEAQLENTLQGAPGWKQVEVNARGRVMNELAGIAEQPKPGDAVVLSIDAELQRTAMESLADESGAVVVMDIVTGEIIVMASAPGFDPNDFVNGINAAKFRELNGWDHKPLFHKAVTGTYSPGSTFKVSSAMAVLEAGIDPKQKLNCPGYFFYGGRAFHCWQKKGHGSIDLHDAVKHSCDVYFYQMSIRMGQQHMADVARQLGFGQKFDISLPSVSPGVVPDQAWWTSKRPKEPWPAGMTLNTVIGQGDVLASPLQLCVMAARIAARGRAVIPRLVIEGGKIPPPAPATLLPFPAAHFDYLHAAMFGVCNEPGGTATRWGELNLARDMSTGRVLDVKDAPPGSPRVRMAGKTGSAQVRSISAAERAGGVRMGESIAWVLRDNALFVCFAPTDAPRYACAVVVEHGEHGASAAAPVAHDVMRATLMRDPASRTAMKLARADKPEKPG